MNSRSWTKVKKILERVGTRGSLSNCCLSVRLHGYSQPETTGFDVRSECLGFQSDIRELYRHFPAKEPTAFR